MIRQFHEFFNLIFGGFLTFGPTGTHSSPPSSAATAAAAAAAPSSVSLSEPRAGALLLLPLLFGTVLYVDIESESSTRKSRRARFPPTTTVTTQWQIFEISFRFQFHRRFASQSRDGGSGGTRFWQNRMRRQAVAACRITTCPPRFSDLAPVEKISISIF